MQQSIKVILNPYAGRWNAKKQIEPLKAELAKAGLSFDLVVTQTPGEGIDIARRAAEAGCETIIAAGGDSTISEVLNGLMQAAEASGVAQVGTLGIIPLGTANDLADMLEIPRDLGDACRKIAAGNTRLIDVCRVNERFFGNNSAIGLEPMVTLEAERISSIKGSMRYIVAAVRAIWKRPAWNASINWDSGSFQGPITLVSVGNSPRTGGAFWMTPEATLDDGTLDFVFAPQMSRLALLRLLPQTFSGNHINHPLVMYRKTRKLTINIDPTPLQADGEVIDREAVMLHYSILPQKLRVIA